MEQDLRKLASGYVEYLQLFEEDILFPVSESAPMVVQPPVQSSVQTLPGTIRPLPASLDEFRQSICDCLRCTLGKTRTKFVFGDGNPNARIVFVGEAPGQDEDLQGIPFVGRAGRLLNQMLAEIGLSRRDVYICNVLKCRPPGNRDPEPVEEATCRPYLMTQLSLINPDVLVCLGRHAATVLLGTEAPMKDLRGRTFPWQGMQVLVTYHPAYYLRNGSQLRLGQQDFQLLRNMYDARGEQAGN